MQSVNLLVTDRSPESAEHINSLLRNSGIKIHVFHAQTSADVKRALDQDCPVLILYADADETDAPLEEVSQLAAAFRVPLALFTGLDDPERLANLLSQAACFVINGEREDLLTESVERLIASAANERNHAERQQRLEELEHRYNLLLESARDAIAYVHEGLHVYGNRAYLEALRVKDESELAGLSLLEMFDAGKSNLKTLLKGFAKGSFPADPLEVKVTRPDRSQFDASLLFSPAQYDGEECTQMMLQPKDEANQLAAELERLRFTDPLTQLHNRKSFVDVLEACITGGHGEGTAAVLYLEPDGFEKLHEELNVESSDAFLTDLASVIRQCLSESDVAARISDRGFAVLAQRPTLAALEELAERILIACREHIVELDERSITLSCSIGLSSVGRLVVDSSDIISGARKAQAQAAEHGDQLVVYRPQLTAVTSAGSEQQRLERIKHALSNHDFYSVQQSIIDLDGEGESEQIIENITFMHSDSGDHGPADYQAVADSGDLGGNIDRQIIPGLLKNMVESDQRHIINLSGNSVLDYAFPGWFAEQVKAACVDGSRIVLQIARQTVLNNLRPTQRLIKEVNELGCRLSISEFNADRRTCQLLEHLDVSYIKLQTALTTELTANAKNQEAIATIVEAADPRGVAVIAEEVTDTSSLAILWQCGIKLIAGSFVRESTQVVAQ
jgi:diguanylate cyclase (GGDEF)-like protein